MTQPTDRETAAELAQRLKSEPIDTSMADQAHRPPSDKPPGYADRLMAEMPARERRGSSLNADDWDMVIKALEHYTTCGRA
jgi:hypothetical protein